MAISPRGRMELRMKQNREISPDRAKPTWIESKARQARKVQVLYYLSRNGQLEHPHFMEVTLSSTEGLYLRDVINRLNILRGKGMPYLFSWSSKRSYKNGYVWHDLSEDDIIYPAQGNDYVLKGSELFEGSSERYQQSTSGKLVNLKQPPEGPHSVRFQDAASSSNKSLIVHKQRMNIVEESTVETDDSCNHHGLPTKLHSTQNISTNVKHSNATENNNQLTLGTNACGSALERRTRGSHGGDSTWSSLELGEYKVYKTESIASTVDNGADAATQTDERSNKRCTKGVSTEEEDENCSANLVESKENHQEDQNPTELSRGEVSPPPSSSASPGSPSAKMKSNGKVNSFRCQSHDEDNFVNTRPRASTVLMQLISCGSIAVKDHNFVMIPHSKSRVSHDESRSFRMKVISSGSSVRKAETTIEDELEYMPENPRLAHLQLEEKEYFSGSLVETKTEKEAEGGVPTLKRSASYNADSSSKSDLLGRSNEKEGNGARAKCIPRKIKSLKKQPKTDVRKTPFRGDANNPSRLSNGISSSTQTTDQKIHANNNLNMAAERGPLRANSFREEQKAIKKEERQTSTTGIVVESQATCQDAEDRTLSASELRQQLQECLSGEIKSKAEQGPKGCRGSKSCKH